VRVTCQRSGFGLPKRVPFCSRLLQNPDQPPLGGPNLDPFPSTRMYCWVSLDPSVPITGLGYWVFLLIVALPYVTAHCNILTMVSHFPFLMLCLPLYSRNRDTRSLPNPENENQQHVNNSSSCIFSNLSGEWLQTFINKI